jgi:hypothetical protein
VLLSAALRSGKAVDALEEGAPPPDSLPAVALPSTSSTASATPSAAPTAASARDIDVARQTGVPALRALAERFPDDPNVLAEIVSIGARDKNDHPAALTALKHLIEIAPARAAADDIRTAIAEIAAGPRETAATAFDVMRTKMGSAGPDLLFEIVQNSPSPSARNLAMASLRDPSVMKQATKALLVAEDLRRNLLCARKPFIARAAADGDARSLPFLKQMVEPCNKKGGGAGLGALLHIGGGGASDCHACITPNDRQAITVAIEAIDKRSGEKR